MQCPRCQHENSSHAKFCMECGTPLTHLDESGSPRASYEIQERALREALDQQTATSEILRVIRSSPTEVEPVFQAIVQSAALLCEATFATLHRFDGHLVTFEAHHGMTETEIKGAHRIFPRPGDRETAVGRTLMDRRLTHIHDIRLDPDYRVEVIQQDFRTVLAVPLLREGTPLGAMGLWRREVRPFTDRQIALLQTFADQAVIAIENVRLFTELQEKNRALTEAHAQVTETLEQQTATSEILRVISSSPTNVQPVFDTIVRSALRLCNGATTAVFRVDGGMLHHPANYGGSPNALAAARARYPRPVGRDSIPGIAILTRSEYEVPDTEDPSAVEMSRETGRILGIRSLFAVPMLRDGEAVGAIVVTRREPGRFAAPEVSLLKTFADQAVIAIENVRLFKELEEKNRALTQAHAQVTEALDQQTATSEILRTIAHTQTDLHPVFETIVRSAARLCHAVMAGVLRTDGRILYLPANYGSSPEALAAVRAQYPRPLDRETVSGAAILTRSVVHVPDVQEPSVVEVSRQAGQVLGYRSLVTVPMLREGEVVGAITVCRREPGRFSDAEVELLKTFADQAVIAIENVRLFTELEVRNTELTEALEQQTATGEVLRVIASSPTNLEPVLEAVIANAVRLAGGEQGHIRRFDGEFLNVVAQFNESDDFLRTIKAIPVRPTQDSAAGRAFLSRRPVHIPDILVDPAYRGPALPLQGRTILAVPLLREGTAIGTISMWRTAVKPFEERQIELVTTFADQAVIAIENVRLFKELEARNRDLTATSEILSVIASSPTELQPVLDALAESAARLCESFDSAVYRLDGDRILLVANHGATLGRAVGDFSLSIRGTVAGQAVRDRCAVHVADVRTQADKYPESSEYGRRLGLGTMLCVPMMKERTPIGVIALRRTEAKLFTDRQVALLQTFADQAVIAIENVRLFKELEARNRDLSEALDQQTATAEILRVISSSPTDAQPVFDTIVSSAVRLCDGLFSALYKFDGELIHFVAHHNYTPEALEAAHRVFPARPTRALFTGRTILERAVVHISGVEVDPEHQHRALRSAIGWRSGLFVPMLREGAPIGVIEVARAEPGPFSDNEIDLLKTFADQAVIAVENVRLFKELQTRTGELTRSVDQLTALGEISQAVSSTLDVETVLQTIVSRASQLAGADGCAIYEYDDATEAFHIRATHNLDPVLVETLRAAPLRKGEGAMGRAAETREPTQVADIAAPGAYQSHIRDTLLRADYRALLSVPLLREGEIIGSLSLNRHTPGEFPPEAVEVLKTFATQSALAIQNARLFREIADKSRQLEVASQHKSEFLANMSHELRTPLNAIIGFSEVLAERMFGDVNDKQAEYLQDILESGRHLLSLINDILDLSKIEAGHMELEPADFDLPSAIDNALTLVRERATRRGITLSCSIDKRLGLICGDERKVKQILLNLLSNALKFTPEGGRIDVGGRLDGEVAEVSVADTGVGIAPADQEAVFEEFRQVGAAEKRAEGTGLGLALSRKFVELHGGTIWVQSEPGRGSTFTFTLPVRPWPAS